jgi:hypothetical protein
MLRTAQKTVWIALFACFVFGFGFAVWSASQHSPPHNSEQPTSAKYQDSDGSKSRPLAKNSPKEGQEEHYWYSTFKEHTAEWLIALFTAVLSLYTARLFYATSGLVDAAQEQSRDMKASIAVAQTTADAARKSAETAEKDLLASHKPLITIFDLELCEPNRHEDRHHISFALRNSGKGLAIVNRIGVTIQTVEYNVDGKQQQKAGFAVSSWNGAIESGDSSDAHRLASDLIGAREWGLIRNEGRLVVFVNFEIVSQDIFHNPIRQVFPFVYNLRSWTFERAPSQWSEEKHKSGK